MLTVATVTAPGTRASAAPRPAVPICPSTGHWSDPSSQQRRKPLVVPRRRRNRPVEAVADVEDGIAVQDLADCHLLLVPSTTDIETVDILFRDRLPNSDLLGTGEIALGRHSRISGPYQLSMED